MPSSTCDFADTLSPRDLQRVAGGAGAGQAEASAALGSMLFRGGINIWAEAVKKNPFTSWATPFANAAEKFWHARPHDPAI